MVIRRGVPTGDATYREMRGERVEVALRRIQRRWMLLPPVAIAGAMASSVPPALVAAVVATPVVIGAVVVNRWLRSWQLTIADGSVEVRRAGRRARRISLAQIRGFVVMPDGRSDRGWLDALLEGGGDVRLFAGSVVQARHLERMLVAAMERDPTRRARELVDAERDAPHE